MASLLELAHEVLHNVLIQCDPAELGKICQTCKALNHYITSNRLLFKEHYMRLLDNPAIESPTRDQDYVAELRRAVELRALLDSRDDETKQANFDFVTSAVSSLLATANPDPTKSLNIQFLNSQFRKPRNTDVFLSASTLFARASATKSTLPLASRQLSAKLHALYGTSIDHLGRRCNSATFPFARATVYDIRGFTDNNMWGPFLDTSSEELDGGLKVDWEKVEAIMVVLGYNMKHFSEHHGVDVIWDTPFAGTRANRMEAAKWAAEDAMKLIKQPDLDVETMDPYNITGTWRRVVCFLDYNDFYQFNFTETIPDDQLRDPIHREEAIRLITLKLYASKIEAPGEHDNPALPVVHFRGSSHSMHPSWDPNANSAIRGTVKLTKEGEVRWTTLSIFHGEARWKSEGIQVGGLRSERGVIGTWFDKDYDDQGPCGPTAFWKLSDTIEETKPPRITPFGYVSL